MTDTRALRTALGNFATGVCVVTVPGQDGEPIGMTINSFSSVSLDPALLLWNIQNDSDCFQLFERANSFAISVLSCHQESLSNFYAQKGSHTILPEHLITGEAGGALLAGAIATFECDVWARYPGGDHTILVGEVKSFTASDEAKPLLFFGGKYAQLS